MNKEVPITPEMVKAFWRYFPSPYEIDTYNEAAVRKVLRAVLRALAKSQQQ